MAGTRKHSDSEISRVLQLAYKGLTTSEIARLVPIKYTTIRNALKRNGVTPLSFSEARKRYYPFDQSAFDNLGDEVIYWAGLLMADGCISGDHRISLCLHGDDKAHLQRFLDFLQAKNHKIRKAKNANCYIAAVSGEKIASRLIELGITSRKSLTAEASTDLVNNKLFWLGEIDGDGSMCIDKTKHSPTIQLAGSYAIIQQYREYLQSVFPWNMPNLSPKGNIATLTAHGGKAMAIIRHLWEGHNLGLPRKRQQAMRFIEEFGHLLPSPDKVKTSKYRGVMFFKGAGHTLKKPWMARIAHKHIGYFATQEEAALAFDAAAKAIYGNEAKLNFAA